MRTDPNEWHNLASETKYVEVIREHPALASQVQRQTGAGQRESNSDLRKRPRHLGRRAGRPGRSNSRAVTVHQSYTPQIFCDA